ncbi:hypothetical protein L2E82_35728 [Cichorium intybus]|uniref:Uncharacterized protein n=1 Tax=Cichorium intybus TaxID=13427 RepID=A0ACB9BPK6_CICIN|nr:hypothetical protein L2E82_35728 [Cichorium intybus]
MAVTALDPVSKMPFPDEESRQYEKTVSFSCDTNDNFPRPIPTTPPYVKLSSPAGIPQPKTAGSSDLLQSSISLERELEEEVLRLHVVHSKSLPVSITAKNFTGHYKKLTL